MNPNTITASEARRHIDRGELRATELVSSCLDHIVSTEAGVGAWQHLDRDYAMAQARELDELRQSGASTGPLHGIPVGIKDIVDTRGWPTECGSPILAGRQPTRDAALVNFLREAGAVIMGKTVTTEFAVFHPGKTSNPHDPTRTPGGSSSGSAAAVAANMVPLAVGTQTNGSMIRPASFCGVYGFKPTKGSISRQGVLRLSRFLDTIGVYARSVEDVALIAEALFRFDDRDPDMVLRAAPELVVTSLAEPPLTPRLAFVKSPVWGQASSDVHRGFEELIGHLGGTCDAVELPDVFSGALDWHRIIMNSDLARNLGRYYESGRDALSATLRGMIEDGQGYSAVEYTRAQDSAEILNAGLDRVFDRYDAIVTPAATGEAPPGLDSTGSPVFCTLWTLVGVPAISLPLLEGISGLPIGVQLVGARRDDARLLRTARWLVRQVAATENHA